MAHRKFAEFSIVRRNVRALIGRQPRQLSLHPRIALALLGLWTIFGMANLATLTGCESMFQQKITDAKVQNISVAELSRLYQDAANDDGLLILLDPRSAKAFEASHIPGAVHLPLNKLPINADRDPAIARHRHIVVYGDNPATPTAIALVKRLLGSRYEGVRFYAGGLGEWTRRGFPVEGRGEAPPPPAEARSDQPLAR